MEKSSPGLEKRGLKPYSPQQARFEKERYYLRILQRLNREYQSSNLFREIDKILAPEDFEKIKKVKISRTIENVRGKKRSLDQVDADDYGTLYSILYNTYREAGINPDKIKDISLLTLCYWNVAKGVNVDKIEGAVEVENGLLTILTKDGVSFENLALLPQVRTDDPLFEEMVNLNYQYSPVQLENYEGREEIIKEAQVEIEELEKEILEKEISPSQKFYRGKPKPLRDIR